MVHTANLHAAVCRYFKHFANFNAVRHDHLDTPVGEYRAFAPEAFELGSECGFSADSFKLEELAIGTPLFDEIADRGDFSVAQDENLVAGFFHVAQDVTREASRYRWLLGFRE